MSETVEVDGEEYEPLELDPEKPLGDLHERRKADNQDITMLVEDWHGRRGTGKTTLSMKLGAALDTTDEGLTEEKTSLAPERVVDAYTSQPKGSAIVSDEGSANLSKYRAGSAINKAMRDIVTMGRIEEKYLIMNAPVGSQIDSDLRVLFDVVIFVQRRGQALVHFVKRNPYKETKFLDPVQKLEWEAIKDPQLRDVYDTLSEEKARQLEHNGEEFYTAGEVEEKLQKARRDTRQETRDEIISRLIDNGDLGPGDIQHGFELTPQRIGQIAREQRS